MSEPTIDVAAIVQDEEEIIHLMLGACEVLLPNLRSVVIVDGGSKDNTIDVINSWRDRLPIDLIGHPFDNFCYQRNRALERCKADVIVGKADADLTWAVNLRERIVELYTHTATVFDCVCFFSVIDAYHYWHEGGKTGYATIFWKNVGLRYVRPIHEYLVWPGEENPKDRTQMKRHDWQSIRHGGRLHVTDIPIFDNSLRKSDAALRNRARRYDKWGALSGEAGIPLPTGDENWCIRNKEALLERKGYRRLPQHIADLVIPGC